jgi:hypothetical protein
MLTAEQIRGGRAMRTGGIGVCLLTALALAVLGVWLLPRAMEAGDLLAIEDDPAQIADHALDGNFDAGRAQSEIETALAAGDADLAKSFADLADERKVALDPALTAKVNVAAANAASTQHAAESFAMGLVTGEPKDMPGLAGTTLGDLFVFGDIRDALREAQRWARGESYDELVLGLAGVGIAVTGATYATMGSAAPARVGLSVAKVARKTARLSEGLAAYIGRTLRGVVDWDKLRGAAAAASITEPAIAIRTAREAVKVERAGGLMHLARDVGRVQSKAGTQAALDGMKIAEGPREMSRVAQLAEKKGGKTRAILKVAGRAAIGLTMAAFDLGVWILGALLTVFAFASSLKAATERSASRYFRWRKERRRLREQRRLAALTMRV